MKYSQWLRKNATLSETLSNTLRISCLSLFYSLNSVGLPTCLFLRGRSLADILLASILFTWSYWLFFVDINNCCDVISNYFWYVHLFLISDYDVNEVGVTPVSSGCMDKTRNPSFSLQWKSDESTKHYLTQMLLATNWRYWKAGKNSRMRMEVQSRLKASALHWNLLGFRKTKHGRILF